MESITIHEYRRRYPTTAPVPTLTQRGDVGGILARIEQRELRRQSRRGAVLRTRQRVTHALQWGASQLLHIRPALAPDPLRRPVGM